jgi:hypothetical protein
MRTDDRKRTITVPERYDLPSMIQMAVNFRLGTTAECPNPWHDTAPIRAIELCPECTR